MTPRCPPGSGTPRCPPGSGTPRCPPGSGTPRCPPGSGTPRCHPGSCTPPFCSVDGTMLCCQQREPSIIPDVATPPLQWSYLYVCLTMFSLCIRQTHPNHTSIVCLMTFVIDSGVMVSSLILIFCSMSAVVAPAIAHRQRI